ncbi:unnamed protein product [Mytilus coruscus]|uniref:Uncharacterized protein n=1 Tax=Mytilus coruscus TaxID=42192 RepID=A0A6J8B5A8_MYTCO|nr:unnamed protein product [Mytilus coruscus]
MKKTQLHWMLLYSVKRFNTQSENCALRSTSYDRKTSPSNCQSSVESRITKTEQDIYDTKDDVAKIFKLFLDNQLESLFEGPYCQEEAQTWLVMSVFVVTKRALYTELLIQQLLPEFPGHHLQKQSERNEHLNTQGLEDVDRSLVHNPHTGRPPTIETKDEQTEFNRQFWYS